MYEPETCPDCKTIAMYVFAPTRLLFSGEKVQDAEYNPGLGCITRNKYHRAEIAKAKGVEEIGNEKPEVLHKHFDRVREQKRDASWADADKGWVGDGTS